MQNILNDRLMKIPLYQDLCNNGWAADEYTQSEELGLKNKYLWWEKLIIPQKVIVKIGTCITSSDVYAFAIMLSADNKQAIPPFDFSPTHFEVYTISEINKIVDYLVNRIIDLNMDFVSFLRKQDEN